MTPHTTVGLKSVKFGSLHICVIACIMLALICLAVVPATAQSTVSKIVFNGYAGEVGRQAPVCNGDGYCLLLFAGQGLDGQGHIFFVLTLPNGTFAVPNAPEQGVLTFPLSDLVSHGNQLTLNTTVAYEICDIPDPTDPSAICGASGTGPISLTWTRDGRSTAQLGGGVVKAGNLIIAFAGGTVSTSATLSGNVLGLTSYASASGTIDLNHLVNVSVTH